MAQGYSDAAAAARDVGVIDKQDIADWQVQMQMKRYLKAGDPDSTGYQTLIEETTEAAMKQTVRDADGQVAGNRENITAWEDAHGNIMHHNYETGNRSKLVDSGDR
jgi:hypothetical protein